MIAESTELGITQLGDADVTYGVQIGPDIAGPLDGVVNSTNASFLVAPSSSNPIVYAQISTDAGHTWYQMPNDVWVNAAGNNDIQYRLDPRGNKVKFLIALG